MANGELVSNWSVDYGDGPTEITVPHAWGQDVPVDWEGPAVYRTTVVVPEGSPKLRFHGVSYLAVVRIDGVKVVQNAGIWDAFDVSLHEFAGQSVEISVEVTKNGGTTYPVREVMSGFLPYVFHTFGGIFRPVELVSDDVVRTAQPSRFEVRGGKIYADDRPVHLRGLLHWGWYPELGHPHPSGDAIQKEIDRAAQLGFNTIKFCLWMPPHEYLERLAAAGMFAWIELPIWDPLLTPESEPRFLQEFERIVAQYRHHDNVIAWTAACELGSSVSLAFREKLTQTLEQLTGSPMVKDNSGGSEMYGGDLREFGTFDDFHPYADVPFFPPLLDSLLPGARPPRPILLGETNDIDVHRDLARLLEAAPFWAQASDDLNAKGVRWQYDLPSVLPRTRFALSPVENRHARLMESSRRKAIFIRKTVTEAIRARDAFSGYVLTGFRDTPISSSGFFDDFDEVRFEPEETEAWNGPDVLFRLPVRRPPWMNGGNRPGFRDPWTFFVGTVYARVGLAVEQGRTVRAHWAILDGAGKEVATGSGPETSIADLSSLQVCEVSWKCPTPGEFSLVVECDNVRNAWPIWVVAKPDFEGWSVDDPTGKFADLPFFTHRGGFGRISTQFREGDKPSILFLDAEHTRPAPFWRESAFKFRNDLFWERVPFAERWERLHAIATDRVLDIDALVPHFGREHEVLMNRVDTRTYEESPLLVRFGHGIVTSLRPYGGLGVQSIGTSRNPAGAAFLRGLMENVAPDSARFIETEGPTEEA